MLCDSRKEAGTQKDESPEKYERRCAQQLISAMQHFFSRGKKGIFRDVEAKRSLTIAHILHKFAVTFHQARNSICFYRNIICCSPLMSLAPASNCVFFPPMPRSLPTQIELCPSHSWLVSVPPALKRFFPLIT